MKRIYLLVPAAAVLLISSANLSKEARSTQKALDEYYAYVPAGNAVINDDTLSVNGFFMGKTEVSNIQYAEFIAALKAANATEKLKIALPDTNLWNNQPYTDYYHRHPAYHDYPAVNITHEAAKLYCEWLTETINKRMAGTGKTYMFRLPERAEFIRAARGDNYQMVYAWGGPYLRNSKGLFLCNFLRMDEGTIHYNAEKKEYEIVKDAALFLTDDFSDVTAPVKSYFPNSFGFYNLNGNVSEMISEKGKAVGGDWKSPGYDVRNESIKDIPAAGPTTGFRVVMSFIESN